MFSEHDVTTVDHPPGLAHSIGVPVAAGLLMGLLIGVISTLAYAVLITPSVDGSAERLLADATFRDQLIIDVAEQLDIVDVPLLDDQVTELVESALRSPQAEPVLVEIVRAGIDRELGEPSPAITIDLAPLLPDGLGAVSAVLDRADLQVVYELEPLERMSLAERVQWSTSAAVVLFGIAMISAVAVGRWFVASAVLLGVVLGVALMLLAVGVLDGRVDPVIAIVLSDQVDAARPRLLVVMVLVATLAVVASIWQRVRPVPVAG